MRERRRSAHPQQRLQCQPHVTILEWERDLQRPTVGLLFQKLAAHQFSMPQAATKELGLCHVGLVPLHGVMSKSQPESAAPVPSLRH